MYTFVFLWTPAINPFANHIPHGMIFACFMTASMVGSAAAGLLMSKTQIRIESYMQVVFGVAAASLFVPFWCHLNPGEAQLAVCDSWGIHVCKIQPLLMLKA
jgi:hypothetical protein